MAVFITTLGKIGHLFLLIIAGFIIMKVARLPKNSTAILSKLVSKLFMPALILSNFMENFTAERIFGSIGFFVMGVVLGVIFIPLGILISRFTAKTSYLRRIHTYGLAFSNYGFMGTAVMSSIAPDIFTDYLIMATPLWIANYSWAVPSLLMPIKEEQNGKKTSILHIELKNLLNPMFVAMVLGMAVGILSIPVPSFFGTAVSSLSGCMSPATMLLTGMCVANIDIKRVLKLKSIYILSVLRLLVFPLALIGAFVLIRFDSNIALSALCILAMPLGLNSVVIPESYGKDTSEASGMAIVSHLGSAITIPLLFSLFDLIIK